MALITYMNEFEVSKSRSVPGDRLMNDLLQEVRRRTGEDWIVNRTHYTKKYWFKRSEQETYYRVGVCIGSGEVQVMTDSGPNGRYGDILEQCKISRYNVGCFLSGMLTGMDEQLRKTGARLPNKNLKEALESAERGLKPFYKAVYNDNGDVTIVKGGFLYDDAVNGYYAYKKVRKALEEIGG